MKSKNKCLHILVPLLIACLILFGAKSINAQEVEDEREFDYAEKGEKGPRKWGEIRKEWAACNSGTMQSPIDMSNERVRIFPSRRRGIIKFLMQLSRIEIQWFGDAGSIFINGTEYPLRYAHWHSPSEHTIHGRRYSVIGFFYKIGKPDQFLSKLMTNISSIIDKKHEESTLGMIDPNDIKIRSKRYYRYMGSLTVPPCTEGVIWTINKKVKTVSRDQVKLLREAVQDYAEENARPLQPNNSRDIYLYGPGVTN
ncbi:hypothetical protein Pfo_028717 [Paulownia fortunei]|nr:hypothetical protein Pfo_028717 [Paulownia fortunei]